MSVPPNHLHAETYVLLEIIFYDLWNTFLNVKNRKKDKTHIGELMKLSVSQSFTLKLSIEEEGESVQIPFLDDTCANR